jgi:UDP-galactopyranose mutase
MEINMYDVIVVGAGLAGAVFSREMAKAGKKVLLLEKRGHIGGNMYEEYRTNGVRVHRYGPHIFHTNNKKIADYVKHFSKWYKYEHCVLCKIDEKLVPIPFNFSSIDILFPGQKASELKKILTSFFGKNSRVSVFDLLECDEEIIKQLGEFIFEKVFLHYTAKQWGVSPEDVDKSTINRVPVIIGYDGRYFHDTFQMMPEKGFLPFFETMLHHINIEISLNTNAKDRLSLDFEKKKILFDNIDFNGVVFFTGPIDDFFDYQFGKLPYRSLNLVFEDIENEYYQTNSVINYPNEEAYTRITEFKYFIPPYLRNRTDKTPILKEYPALYVPFENEPYYPIINETNNHIYEKYARLAEQFGNIYPCGRLGEYKYYNMDAVIDRALFFSEKIKKDLSKRTIQVLLKRFPLIKEMLLYGFIGLLSANLDGLVFFILRRLQWNLYAANFIGVNLGICCSFLLNSFFNFRITNKIFIRALRFFLIGYLGLLLSMGIMYIGIDILGYQDMIIKIISVFLVALFQFLLNKFITFRI